MFKTIALASAAAVLVLGSIAVAQTATPGGAAATYSSMNANPAGANASDTAAATPDSGSQASAAGERG